jgi:hypothetical protein
MVSDVCMHFNLIKHLPKTNKKLEVVVFHFVSVEIQRGCGHTAQNGSKRYA